MKRVATLLCVCVLLFSFGTTSALANHDEIPTGIASADPYYTDEYTVNSFIQQRAGASFMNTPVLSISSPSTGKLSVMASVSTTQVVAQLGYTILTIEKWNGSSWVSALSWSDKYSYNTSSFSWAGSASNCESGGNYRVSCTFYAKNGTSDQSISATTSYITCK